MAVNFEFLRKSKWHIFMSYSFLSRSPEIEERKSTVKKKSDDERELRTSIRNGRRGYSQRALCVGKIGMDRYLGNKDTGGKLVAQRHCRFSENSQQ